jgi:hypothetical protein
VLSFPSLKVEKTAQGCVLIESLWVSVANQLFSIIVAITMPTPVYDLSPHQLEWLYSNQTLTGGEPLGEEGNCSQQEMASPTTTTQILFTESEKLKTVPEVEHDDEETETTEGIDSDMTAVARKRRPGEAFMMPEITRHHNGSSMIASTQKQHKKVSSLFPHTNERLTWEQSFANLQVYHAEFGVSPNIARLLAPG